MIYARHCSLILVCSRQLEEMCDILPNGSTVVIYGNLSGEEQIMIKPRTLIANNLKISRIFYSSTGKGEWYVKKYN